MSYDDAKREAAKRWGAAAWIREPHDRGEQYRVGYVRNGIIHPIGYGSSWEEAFAYADDPIDGDIEFREKLLED